MTLRYPVTLAWRRTLQRGTLWLVPLTAAIAGCSRYPFRETCLANLPHAASAIAWEQTDLPPGTIEGRIVGIRTQLLSNAQIALDSGGRTWRTAKGGLFRVDSLAAGQYTLRARGIGYMNARHSITLDGEKGVSVLIVLGKTRLMLMTGTGRIDLTGIGCTMSSSPAAFITPEALASDSHLSAMEQHHLAHIQRIHEPGLGLVRRFRESGLLADSAEWWVAGDRSVLPFAGSWRGLAGIAEFESRLGATMRYDKVELREYLVSGNQVAAIFLGEGVARATGIPFRSEIVRIYTFEAGKVVRVRNYYDTGAYVRAVLGAARTQ